MECSDYCSPFFFCTSWAFHSFTRCYRLRIQ